MFFGALLVWDRVVFVLRRAGLRMQAAEKAVGLGLLLGPFSKTSWGRECSFSSAPCPVEVS